MVLKILRFSVLSVFCVLTAISSVYAHKENEITRWKTLRHHHDDDGNHVEGDNRDPEKGPVGDFFWHYHKNAISRQDHVGTSSASMLSLR